MEACAVLELIREMCHLESREHTHTHTEEGFTPACKPAPLWRSLFPATFQVHQRKIDENRWSKKREAGSVDEGRTEEEEECEDVCVCSYSPGPSHTWLLPPL